MDVIPTKKKNNKGVALVLVLMVLCVFAIIASAFTVIVLSANKSATTNEKAMQAHYIASSGVDAVKAYILKNPDSASIQKLLGLQSLNTPLGPDNGYFYVKVTGIIGENITITSTGVIPGTSGNADITSHSEMTMSYSSSSTLWAVPTFDVAVFSLGTITLTGGANLIGSAGTNSTTTGAVDISGGKINGDLLLINGDLSLLDTRTNVTGAIVPLSAPRLFSMPKFPVFPTDLTSKGDLLVQSNQTISTDGYYSSISISNGLLTFDVGTGIRRIMIDSLNCQNQGINVIGTGTLILYINNSMSFGSGTLVNPANPSPAPEKILIYYNGTNPASFSSGSNGSVIATLYASQASNITMSGGTAFTGNIISGGPKVTLSGGSSAYVHAVIAPNATVNMSGGSQLSGAIIAKDFTASGGCVVTSNSSITFPSALIQGSSTTGEGYVQGKWR